VYSAHPRYTLLPYTTLFRSRLAFVCCLLFSSTRQRSRNANAARRKRAPLLRNQRKPPACSIKSWGRARDRSRATCSTAPKPSRRSEEHTSELQSHLNLVCRL